MNGNTPPPEPWWQDHVDPADPPIETGSTDNQWWLEDKDRVGDPDAPVSVPDSEVEQTDPKLLEQLKTQLEKGQITSYRLFVQAEQDREGWGPMIDALGANNQDVLTTSSPHYLVITTRPLNEEVA